MCHMYLRENRLHLYLVFWFVFEDSLSIQIRTFDFKVVRPMNIHTVCVEIFTTMTTVIIINPL